MPTNDCMRLHPELPLIAKRFTPEDNTLCRMQKSKWSAMLTKIALHQTVRVRN